MRGSLRGGGRRGGMVSKWGGRSEFWVFCLRVNPEFAVYLRKWRDGYLVFALVASYEINGSVYWQRGRNLVLEPLS